MRRWVLDAIIPVGSELSVSGLSAGPEGLSGGRERSELRCESLRAECCWFSNGMPASIGVVPGYDETSGLAVTLSVKRYSLPRRRRRDERCGICCVYVCVCDDPVEGLVG